MRCGRDLTYSEARRVIIECHNILVAVDWLATWTWLLQALT